MEALHVLTEKRTLLRTLNRIFCKPLNESIFCIDLGDSFAVQNRYKLHSSMPFELSQRGAMKEWNEGNHRDSDSKDNELEMGSESANGLFGMKGTRNRLKV